MTANKQMRTEGDLLGDRQLPADALYGVQTLRGMENFQISNFKLSQYPYFIQGLAYTKWGAAIANHSEGILTDEQYEAIVFACKELIAGKHHDAFEIDMIQGGAGTTTNMAANEVICNIALQKMGHKPGEYKHLAPNDGVNASQSTNDAYPTAIHLGLYPKGLEVYKHVEQLIAALRAKAEEMKHVLKIGRTQLQDAVPMTLGQTFHGFASILEDELPRLKSACEEFLTVNMGATAIGTGIASEPGYAEACVEALAEITGWPVKLSADLVGATSDTSVMIGYSSALRRIAVKINKICNDIRLLSSGPRAGIGEFNVPAVQPGSSIMPGKVNPVIPEVMSQVCYKVMGNDTTVLMAGDAAQMELNAMEPVMAQCCFESSDLMMHGITTLIERCITGITPNEERCRQQIEASITIVTALNPIIGYKNSTKIAKEALETGKGIYELVLEHGILDKKDLNEVMDPKHMTQPSKLDHIKPKKQL